MGIGGAELGLGTLLGLPCGLDWDTREGKLGD